MTTTYVVVIVVSAALFLAYGLLCLFSGGMRTEFERFGLARYRRLTGGLEVLGGVGLLAGILVPEVLLLASAGLAVLMLLGVVARLRVRDTVLETLPAALLLVVNLVILTRAWNLIGTGALATTGIS